MAKRKFIVDQVTGKNKLLCSCCENIKPVEFFYKQASAPLGIGYICKFCDAEKREKKKGGKRKRKSHYLRQPPTDRPKYLKPYTDPLRKPESSPIPKPIPSAPGKEREAELLDNWERAQLESREERERQAFLTAAEGPDADTPTAELSEDEALKRATLSAGTWLPDFITWVPEPGPEPQEFKDFNKYYIFRYCLCGQLVPSIDSPILGAHVCKFKRK